MELIIKVLRSSVLFVKIEWVFIKLRGKVNQPKVKNKILTVFHEPDKDAFIYSRRFVLNFGSTLQLVLSFHIRTFAAVMAVFLINEVEYFLRCYVNYKI